MDFRWSRKLSGGPKMHPIAPFFSKFSGGACPLTPLDYFESTFFIGCFYRLIILNDTEIAFSIYYIQLSY